MEGVNVGMVEDHASPPGPLALGRLRDEIEIAPSRSKARECCVVATVNDLKSQHAVEADGPRHIVGSERDGADALDHGGNAPLHAWAIRVRLARSVTHTTGNDTRMSSYSYKAGCSHRHNNGRSPTPRGEKATQLRGTNAIWLAGPDVTRILPSGWRSITIVALSLVAKRSRTFSSVSVSTPTPSAPCKRLRDRSRTPKKGGGGRCCVAGGADAGAPPGAPSPCACCNRLQARCKRLQVGRYRSLTSVVDEFVAGPVWVIDRDRRVPFVVVAGLVGDVYTPLDMSR